MPIGATNYPTALDDATSLIRVVNRASSTIGAGGVDSTAPTIPVTDAATFAADGVVWSGTEAISYTGKTGTSLTGCTRGFDGTTAAAHAAGDPIYGDPVIAARFDVLQDAIIAIETLLGANGTNLYGRAVGDPARFSIDDHFASGNTATGQVGALGWVTASGTVVSAASESGRPGIYRRETGTTSGTVTSLVTKSIAGVLFPEDAFDMRWVVRVGGDGAAVVRVGLLLTALGNPPTGGIYFEKLAGDTNWYVVTRHAAAETRTDTTVPVGAGWHVLRLRRIDATTIGFTVNGGTEITHTTNIPSGAVQWVALQLANATAVNQTVDIDYFSLAVSGLTY